MSESVGRDSDARDSGARDSDARDSDARDSDAVEYVSMQGHTTFSRPVPYRLYLPAGSGEPVPLLIALHGKGDRAERFEDEALDALPEGWGLLVPSAPIPRDRDRPREGRPNIGDSWYVYDGDTPVFRQSMARAELHLLDLISRLRHPELDVPRDARPVDPDRFVLLGFSQGAYLAGVVAVRHPGIFRAAVMVGGRLKVEALEPWLPPARDLRLLAIHGRDDKAVMPGPARESIERARAVGLTADFVELDGGHEFNPVMRETVHDWLVDLDL